LALTIAATKAPIVAAIFMELRRGSALIISFAGAGFFWLGILLWLAFADVATRPGVSDADFTLAIFAYK
jgi:cytochrome c oxidase subunit 4